MSTTRKLLTSALVVGLVSAVIGAGTFASFSAQTSNQNNTFATGTLVLSNKVNTGSTCLSTAGGSTDTNVNNGCDTFFALSAQKPDGTVTSANLTLKNEGSIDASALKAFSTGCTNTDTAGSYHGTGLPCSAVQLKIQEMTDNTFATPLASGSCLYGGTSCAFDSSHTLAGFASAYTDSTTPNSLGLGAFAAGATRYLKVSITLPTTAGNTYQGRNAAMGFSWYAEQ